MKNIATYCLLLAWSGYFMFGQLAPIWASISSVNNSSCHVEKETEENKADCCAKLHKAKKETEGSNNRHGEKDDCGQKDCTLSCCHLSAVVLATIEPAISVYFIVQPVFSGIQNNLLPNPFVGVASPPPNC